MLGNATLLSVVYLIAAVGVEAARRVYSPRWSEKASLAIEALPARALELTGLLGPLRRAFVYGDLSAWVVRLVFGATAVAIIFTMALLVGAGMWCIRRWWESRTQLQ
jgi:predicted lipid-binding transport protein (Tim44 family)